MALTLQPCLHTTEERLLLCDLKAGPDDAASVMTVAGPGVQLTEAPVGTPCSLPGEAEKGFVTVFVVRTIPLVFGSLCLNCTVKVKMIGVISVSCS